MNFHVVRIDPEDNEENTLLMHKVYAVNILEQDASRQLVQLNTHHPLPPSLHHVKRIWRRQRRQAGEEDCVELSLLLGFVNDGKVDEWQQICEKLGVLVKGEIKEAEVPHRMPKSRLEYEEWRRREYWPTVFHEDKMRIAREQEEMLLIQKLSALVIDHVKEKTAESIYDDYAILFHPTKETLEAEYWKKEGDDAALLEDPVLQVISQIAASQLDTRKRTLESSYLCTGMVLFCGREPSLMTAMALVHSRIRSIVFVKVDENRGALLSRLKLHSFSSLNHHFSVYQLMYA